jgi:signal peptidase I
MDNTNNSNTPPIVEGSGGAKTSPRRENVREFVSTIFVLVAALVVALGLINYVFQSYEVDGPSMMTTLDNHDRLIVWKAPRTWARITGHQYVPERGNIIIFVQSDLAEFGQQDSKQLIKRVVGLPGERVVVANGVVTIFNKEYPRGFQPDKTLPYGKGGSTIPLTSGNIDVTLAKDQIFVCGDNRGDSLDSRSFGPVSLNHVVGKLVYRLLPISNAEKF